MQRPFVLLAVLLALAALLALLGRGTREPEPASALAALDSAENAAGAGKPADARLSPPRGLAARLPGTEVLESPDSPAREQAGDGSTEVTANARAGEVAVHVTDDRGLDVADAELELRGRGEVWRPVGRTDERGRATLAVPASAGARVRASAADRIRAELAFPDPLPARVQLVLATRGALGGAVRWSDRTRVGAGIEVRATPVPTEAKGEPELSGAEPFATTLTDERGRFVLEELDAAREYRVSVHGLGLVCEHPPLARPGRRTLRLDVDVLYAALVRLVEPDGSPVREPDGRWIIPVPIRFPTSLESPSVKPALATAAGLPPELVTRRADRRLVLRVAAPTASGELEPVEIPADVAGYTCGTARIRPRSLQLGMAETELVLERFPRGALRLETALPHDPDGLPGPEVSVVLKASDRGELYSVRLGEDGALLEDVTAGTWSASVRLRVYAASGNAAVEREELRIEPGGETSWRFDLDLSRWGRVCFARGTRGTLVRVLSEEDEADPLLVEVLVFDATDGERVELVGPGEYGFARGWLRDKQSPDGETRTVFVPLPGEGSPRDEVLEPSHHFTVLAGETTVVDVPSR